MENTNATPAAQAAPATEPPKTPVMNYQEHWIEIVDQNLDAVSKVGKMASLCYRTQAKEGSERETAERIIKHCLGSDHPHLSILDHAAFCLHLPTDMCYDSNHILEAVTGLKRPLQVPFRQIFESIKTETQQRYTFPVNDPSLYMKKPGFGATIDTKDQGPEFTPAILADGSAWRSILTDKMAQATAIADDPIMFLVCLRVLQSFGEVCPVMFGDLVDKTNEALAAQSEKGSLDPESVRCRCWDNVIAKVEPDKRTVDGIVEHFFKQPQDIYAGEADPCFTFSVIIHTDRGTTHQLVRHRRDVGYSQESQRYVNYDNKGFGAMNITVDPRRVKEGSPLEGQVDLVTGEIKKDSAIRKVWEEAMQTAATYYSRLIEMGLPPESARGVLPNDTATTIGVTWIMPGAYCNFLFYRLDSHAQYNIRRLAAETIIKGCESNHPFFTLMSPEHIINFVTLVQDQHIFGDDKSETYKKIFSTQETRMKRIQQYIEDQQKAAEERAKAIRAAQEAEAKKVQEAPEVQVNEPGEGHNEIPPGAKVIKVHPENEQAPEVESITQRPPTVNFEKPNTVDPHGPICAATGEPAEPLKHKIELAAEAPAQEPAAQ